MGGSVLFSNLVTFALTSITCGAYISGLGFLARQGLLEKNLSRKIMHIGNGLLFLLFWPFFSNHEYCRYLCASVPQLAATHFLLVGLGIVQDESLVVSATRSGDRRELLRGPFQYGTVIGLLTAGCWRASPCGVLAVSCLCAGDGLADIVGRRLGSSNKLFYSPLKSLAGTLACFLGGWMAGWTFLLYFRSYGVIEQHVGGWEVAAGSALTALVGALVESLPLAEVDNVTVPLSVALTARAYYGF